MTLLNRAAQTLLSMSCRHRIHANLISVKSAGSKMKFNFKCAGAAGTFLIFGLTITSNSNAQTIYAVTGHITSTFVSHYTNYPFRITLDASLPTACLDGFIYVSSSDQNYQVYVSSLMLSYSTGKPVSAEYTIDSNGFCLMAEFRG